MGAHDLAADATRDARDAERRSPRPQLRRERQSLPRKKRARRRAA
jgi:hypothetical protein